MIAVVAQQGALQVKEVLPPDPGPRDLLVSVRGAALNASDLARASGAYPGEDAGSPVIPGLELAGIVVSTGADCSRFTIGDRVMGIVAAGGHGELALLDERVAIRVPAGLDLADAGALPEGCLVAAAALLELGSLAAGQRVLVQAAAGGIGSVVAQVARGLGADVRATVLDENLRERLRSLGFKDVRIATQNIGDRDVDLVVELLGTSNLHADLDALAVGGRIVIVGIGLGATIAIEASDLMAKQATISGLAMRNRNVDQRGQLVSSWGETLSQLIASGEVSPVIHERYPLLEAQEAFEAFSDPYKFGKILLTPRKV